MMRAVYYVFVVLCSLHSIICQKLVYSDQWAVYVEGGSKVADQIAEKHGFVNRGQILKDHYHFTHNKVVKRSYESNDEHHQKLVQERNVKWVQQQVVKSRTKRQLKGSPPWATRQSTPVVRPLNDPRWPQMWYLNRGHGLDMNVQTAWLQDVTGKGVVVTILDDGLEKDHPDIKRNYDPLASYDVNNHDDDPQPRYDLIDSNRHGTRCAGEVAADANNSICAVGVAYDAKVGGVRMLDGDVTDAVEARSLSLNRMHIDIYSASWGPDDDGKTVDGPGELATRAFIEGVTHGRNGLGSIFVWASGNGGRDHDNCNCDGYTNSIWTLSISSATENGLVPWYSEHCSSTLATTYSSGSSGEKQVVTTDLHHGCTSSHTGTSASAPLAAGICALALQVNRRLTWRDMQHIVVRSARPGNLRSDDWATNGVGRNVSHAFGYGLMDAATMVELARNWTTVPEQKTCEVQSPHRGKLIPAKSVVKLDVRVPCPEINYLEHVQAKISLSAARRGDIHLYLISPMNTRSTLLFTRPHDNSRAGFQAWPFMTVHSWGENPTGTWTLEIHNDARYQGKARLEELILIFYGTTYFGDEPKPTTTTSTSTTKRTTTTFRTSTTTLRTTTTSISSIAKSAPWLRKDLKPVGSVLPKNNKDNNVFSTDQQNGAATLGDWRMLLYGTKENPDRKQSVDVAKSSCTRYNSAGICLECPVGLQLEGVSCVLPCPSGTFDGRLSSWSEVLSNNSLQCLPCHYSCNSCEGANDYQCLTCYGDAILTNDGHCYLISLQAALEHARKWQAVMTVLFFVFGLVVLCLAIYLACISRRHSYANRNYGKIMSDKKNLIKPYSDDEQIEAIKCCSEDDDR